MTIVDDKIKVPNALPEFKNYMALKNWVLYPRYAEPTHLRRVEGFGIYDREEKRYTQSAVEKEET